MKVIKPNDISLTGGSFYRSTVGTYYDVNGEIKTAAPDTPRFQYNPTTGLFDGMLIEQASTNLIAWSSKFDNPVWYAGNCTLTSSANSFYPSGVYTLKPTAANAALTTTLNTTVGTRYTISIYIKKITLDETEIYFTDSSWNPLSYVSVNLNTSSANYGGGTYSLKVFKNGWIRVTLTATATTSISYFNVETIYTAGTTKEMFIACSQLEVGDKATSYIHCAGAATTRTADVVSTTQSFIYSNAVNANSDWSSSTSYGIGSRANYKGYIYEAISSNTNKNPETSTTDWVKVTVDNKHAALDASASTASEANGDLIISFIGGSFDSLGVINMEGLTLEIAISDFTGNLYTNQIGISGTEVSSWYDYFFLSPLQDLPRTQVVVYNLDTSTHPTAITTVRIKNGTSISSVGLLSVGKLFDIGGTQYGASAGITDYSVKSTDEYGNTTFLQRNYSKKLNTRVYVNNPNLNMVQRLLYTLRATPCIWIGTEDPIYEEAMVIWGFYKDFTTEISYPSYALVSIEIEGLA